MPQKLSIPWLEPDDPFPATHLACTRESGMEGLLAAGGQLNRERLLGAYSQGIFPWFSEGQPILWWSPNPRMVLMVDAFRCHRSLRQTIKQWQRSGQYRLSLDEAFESVIQACASKPRVGQSGTWILPPMQEAYTEFHRAGHAHSLEVWKNGQLIAGLYFVNLGRAIFGESMFSYERDASKVALCALVSAAKAQGASWIDCQQNTSHLASMGAAPIPRHQFEALLRQDCDQANLQWDERWLYWDAMLQLPRPA